MEENYKEHNTTITLERHHEILAEQRAWVRKMWHTRLGYLLFAKRTPDWIKRYIRELLRHTVVFGDAIDMEMCAFLRKLLRYENDGSKELLLLVPRRDHERRNYSKRMVSRQLEIL